MKVCGEPQNVQITKYLQKGCHEKEEMAKKRSIQDAEKQRLRDAKKERKGSRKVGMKQTKLVLREAKN